MKYIVLSFIFSQILLAGITPIRKELKVIENDDLISIQECTKYGCKTLAGGEGLTHKEWSELIETVKSDREWDKNEDRGIFLVTAILSGFAFERTLREPRNIKCLDALLRIMRLKKLADRPATNVLPLTATLILTIMSANQFDNLGEKSIEDDFLDYAGAFTSKSNFKISESDYQQFSLALRYVLAKYRQNT